MSAVSSDLPYVSFENPDVMDHALGDPRGFLSDYPSGAVFDEVQRAPDIIRYLQQIVDEAGSNACFVLTGSQQFGVLSGVSQSLAGRSVVLHLLPFSLSERYRGGNPPRLDEVLYTGLYPPIHDRAIAPHAWLDSYIQLYVERDVRQLVNVRDLSAFRRFVQLCAGRTGQILNRAQLANDCGLATNTVAAWLSVLEASYVIFLLQPHFENFNKRLIKAPKLYFYDTGLAARLLGIRSPAELAVHSLRGHLFETFVVAEFVKARLHGGERPRLSYWRNNTGLEVDLIEESGERLLPLEIKSGATLNREFFANLERWAALAGERAGPSRLVYGGETSGLFRGVRYLSWRELSRPLDSPANISHS
ncbi:MAG: ATP-binding protein [Spirochaetaceae bacterium]|nr:MAG: ATP-binding protein [Spirochaetaceae bacterium]